jgi:hypothetical protein
MMTTTTTTTTKRTTSELLAVARRIGAVALIASASCSQNPARSAKTETPLRNGPLTDFVPSAGLRWMAVGRPADLANMPILRPFLADLLPSERLDAFALSTGIDLRETPNALAAGFDYGSLYVAETPFDNRVIEKRFTDRLVAGASVESKHPRVRRISGTVGLSPEALLRVDRRFVAFAVGDPSQTKIVELYLTGRLSRSPSALRGSALREVPADFATAPFRFYAPGPFTGEWATGAHGLLGAASAFAAAAAPEGDSLKVRAVLVGNYQGEDLARLSSAWADLAESSMGRLTGLDRPISPPATDLGPGRLTLEVKIALAPFFAGLRAAVAADVWEMLGGRAPTRPLAPTPSQKTEKPRAL